MINPKCKLVSSVCISHSSNQALNYMIKQVVLVNLFAIIIFWKITTLAINLTPVNYEHADFSETSDLDFVKQDAWYSGQNASMKNSEIWLNPDPNDGQTSKEANIGKVVLKSPVHFKPSNQSGIMASFSTSFSFQIITTKPYPDGGSGLLFFISDYDKAPEKSYGRYLGMVAPPNYTYHFFAIEFDTHQSDPFSDVSASHIGIDVNSLHSLADVDTSANSIANPELYPKLFLYSNHTFTAWVNYDAAANLTQVWLTNSETSQRPSSPCLNLTYDLASVFKAHMYVGFSATNNASQDGMEGHVIKSWNFSTQYFNLSGKQSKVKNNIIIAVCVIAGVICFLALLCIYFCIKRRNKTGPDAAPTPRSGSNIGNPVPSIPRYTLGQLKRATHGFARENKIGEGGYSVVYKGTVEDGSIVALKKLKKKLTTEKQESEFLAELQIISDIRHRHLLPLQGWCYEKGEAIFVYMYMSRGSLDTYLYGRDGRENLPTDTRYGILQGIASALEYLHFGLAYCVLHRDVKAANVLLTEEFAPLLCDFGLARQKKHSQEEAVTMTAAGTTGYVAPEVVFQARFSDKSDVYGFGVLALEVACGRRAIDHTCEDMNAVRLVEWVWSLHVSDRLIDALDSRMSAGMSPYQKERWRGVLHFALLCCSPEREMRPSVRQISQSLQGDHSVLLTQPLPRTQRAYTLSIGP